MRSLLRRFDNAFFFLAAAIVGFVGLRAVLGVGVAPRPAVFADSPASLRQAMERAKQEGKLVFAFATADWCGPCQRFKRTALVDPRVEALLQERTVPVYIDVDKAPEDAAALAVMGIPSSNLLTPEGEIVARMEGAVGASALLRWLQKASQRSAEAALDGDGAAVLSDDVGS